MIEDPHHDGFCARCGQPSECTLCSDCRVEAGFDAEERDDAPKRRGRVQCEVCGRGLNAEDEAMNNGMCVPCATT